MKFWVYILTSDKDGSRYVGSGKDVEERLKRHNKGDYRYTKGHRPWQVTYTEEASSRSKAVQRERFLKSGFGRKELDKLISDRSGNCPVV